MSERVISPGRVMAFNACVMRLQVIGEHVGKLLKENANPLECYPNNMNNVEP
jgi:uncharacterized protein with HEPN domain